MERISIGFAAGQVLSLRVGKDALAELTTALSGQSLWHSIAAEDGAVNVRLDSIVYLRSENPESKVGFGL